MTEAIWHTQVKNQLKLKAQKNTYSGSTSIKHTDTDKKQISGF